MDLELTTIVEINRVFDAFKASGQPGNINGFLVLQSKDKIEDPLLRAFSKESHKDLMAWNWRQWKKTLSQEPEGVYFFCFEDKTKRDIETLMQYLDSVLNNGRRNWDIMGQPV